MEPVGWGPIGVFASAFVVSALAGLAALLRSGVKPTWLVVLSAILNSGFMGLGISLLWFSQYQDNVPFLVGVCVLAGLGGMTTVDFVVALFRTLVLNAKLQNRKDDEEKEDRQ